MPKPVVASDSRKPDARAETSPPDPLEILRKRHADAVRRFGELAIQREAIERAQTEVRADIDALDKVAGLFAPSK